MLSTRREFLACSAAAVTGWTLAPGNLVAADASSNRNANGLRILILGGTGFLGPSCTEAALARGHAVTHFNSGRTEGLRQKAGRPSVVPAGVEQLYGNRDPNKTADDRKSEGQPDATKSPDSPKGLSQLVGKKWDAVIDTSGFFPRMVKASAELLRPNVRQYIFISSISAYKDMSTPDFDETAPLATLSDPATEEMGKDFVNYGGGKALCERVAETAMPGRVTVIRPGYIVGPRDTSGRFIYWPVRESLGGVMVVPGAPADPIQFIDVRDLGEWIIHCIEANIVGVYNATGPAKPLTMKGMLKGIREGVKSQVSFTWLDYKFLQSQGVGEGQFPLYEPPEGESAGAHRCDIKRALAKGLRFRSVSDTAAATLAWYKSLAEELQSRVAPQFATKPGETPWLEKEKGLLDAWRKRAGK
jgi:2'-hydroxyisoflavone reductase